MIIHLIINGEVTAQSTRAATCIPCEDDPWVDCKCVSSREVKGRAIEGEG